MSLEYHILGAAGRDNALLVYVHGGDALGRVLFDCGDGCLSGLPFAEISRIDALFFSHLHMDHIGGFDAFFRCTYDRTLRPNRVWGPPGSAKILQHRFQGFLWNLADAKQATWEVAEVHPDRVTRTRFRLGEQFRTAHPAADAPRAPLLDTPHYTVEAIALDHLTVSLGYVIRERPRRNIDVTRLAARGLKPGPWLRTVKEAPDETRIDVDGIAATAGELRALLLVEQPGEAVAYLTDFRLDADTLDRLVPLLRGCKALVCECAYRAADAELAARNAHLTAPQAAEIAATAGVGTLVLIHLSDRYPPEEWPAILDEARAIFPNTVFPRDWTR